MSTPDIIVEEAPNVPFYTPAQTPPAGSAVDVGKPIPKLFQPLTIRGLEFHNRIFVSDPPSPSTQKQTIDDPQVISFVPILCEEWLRYALALGSSYVNTPAIILHRRV